MRAAAAPSRGPEGRLKQACPRPERQQEEPAGCRRRIGGPGVPLGSRRTRRRSTVPRPPASAPAHAPTGSSAGMDAGGALVRLRADGARRMRAAAAPFRGPEGRLKQACPRSERQQEEPAGCRRRDGGPGLPLGSRRTRRRRAARPSASAPHAHTPRIESSAGMDAGGALVDRATTEPAGCGRPPRHPAARRAA